MTTEWLQERLGHIPLSGIVTGINRLAAGGSVELLQSDRGEIQYRAYDEHESAT